MTTNPVPLTQQPMAVSHRIKTATVTFDATGKILAVNHQFPNFFGVGSEVYGRQVHNLFSPKYREIVADHIEEYRTNPEHPEAMAKLEIPHVAEAVDKDGAVFLVRYRIAVSVKGSESLREATSKAPIALPVFLMKMENLTDTSAFLSVDASGTIVDSRNCLYLLGYRDDELIGRSVTILAPEPFIHAADNPIMRFIRSESERTTDDLIPVLCNDRRVVPARLHIEATADRYLRIDAPATVDGRFYAVRLDDERGLEAVCNVSSEGVLLDCTETFALMFGYRVSEVCGMSFKQLFPAYVEESDTPAPGTLLGRSKTGATVQVTMSMHALAGRPSSATAPAAAVAAAADAGLLNKKSRSIHVISPSPRKQNPRKRLAGAAPHTGPVFAFVVSRVDLDSEEEKREGEYFNPKGLLVGDYEIGNLLAEGGFAQLRTATHFQSRLVVAAKVFNKQRCTAEQMQLIHREIELMRALTDSAALWQAAQPDSTNAVPPVIRLHDMVESSHHLYLFMDYAPQCLDREVLWRDQLPEAEAKRVFLKLLRALQWMHHRGIAHLDIEPGNVLFTPAHTTNPDPLAGVAAGDLRLCDFGSGRYIKSDKQTFFCGNVQYAAPEMLLGRSYYGPECDVWSAGVTLYVMLTGNLWIDLMAAVTEDFYVDPENVSAECQDLLRKILVVDSDKRPDISTILRHPWLKELASPPHSHQPSPRNPIPQASA